MLRDVSALYTHTQIVLLVDEATAGILRTCTFQTSPDGRKWVSSYWPSNLVYLQEIQTTLSSELACVGVDLKRMLLECSIGTGDPSTRSESGTRYFRAHLTGDKEEKW